MYDGSYDTRKHARLTRRNRFDTRRADRPRFGDDTTRETVNETDQNETNRRQRIILSLHTSNVYIRVQVRVHTYVVLPVGISHAGACRTWAVLLIQSIMGIFSN